MSSSKGTTGVAEDGPEVCGSPPPKVPKINFIGSNDEASRSSDNPRHQSGDDRTADGRNPDEENDDDINVTASVSSESSSSSSSDSSSSSASSDSDEDDTRDSLLSSTSAQEGVNDNLTRRHLEVSQDSVQAGEETKDSWMGPDESYQISDCDQHAVEEASIVDNDNDNDPISLNSKEGGNGNAQETACAARLSDAPPPLPPMPPLPSVTPLTSIFEPPPQDNNEADDFLDNSKAGQSFEEAFDNASENCDADYGADNVDNDNGDETKADSLDSDDSIEDTELHDLLENEVPVERREEEEIRPRREHVKVIVDDRGKSGFELLPLGWVKTYHKSGMPVYLHRESRVVTLSKPYFLGKGSLRRHTVPVESIPCLNYSRALEEEEAFKKARRAEEDAVGTNGQECPLLPKARVETMGSTAATASVTPEELQEYCRKLFRFKEIHMRKFRNWKERRKFDKQVVQERVKKIIDDSKKKETNNDKAEDGKVVDRPSLPKGTKLITIPVVELEAMDENHEDNALYQRVVKKSKKEWLLNPSLKSSICILHEYVQHSLKKQPVYEFEEIESSTTPYSATVFINGLQYGKGFGSSKKIAKSEAAAKTLAILIPEIKDKFDKDKADASNSEVPDLSLFENIRITDPRVLELSNKTSEPSPYAILKTCLQRNYGLGDTSIHMDLRPMRHKRNEFYMRVNEKEVSVICKNKRDGKQMAAQKLLQQLHPLMKSWGSLLSLYGSRSILSQRAKKEKESEITGLQSRNASRPTPSLAILEKLKEEMRNVSQMKKAVAPLGKFVPPLDSQTPGMANSCLEKVDL